MTEAEKFYIENQLLKREIHLLKEAAFQHKLELHDHKMLINKAIETMLDLVDYSGGNPAAKQALVVYLNSDERVKEMTPAHLGGLI